jgi:hypothetical protein
VFSDTFLNLMGKVCNNFNFEFLLELQQPVICMYSMLVLGIKLNKVEINFHCIIFWDITILRKKNIVTVLEKPLGSFGIKVSIN